MNDETAANLVHTLTIIASSAGAARDAISRAHVLRSQAASIPAVVAPDPNIAGIIRSNGHAKQVAASAVRPSVGDPAALRAKMLTDAEQLEQIAMQETRNALSMARLIEQNTVEVDNRGG